LTTPCRSNRERETRLSGGHPPPLGVATRPSRKPAKGHDNHGNTKENEPYRPIQGFDPVTWLRAPSVAAVPCPEIT
ncbi:hypothetical protein HPB47_024848, partial [Ixodes persulcatus]